MTIKDTLRILLPKIKFIVIFPVIFVIAATGFVSLTGRPTYSATTQLMLLKVGEFITPESIDKAEKLMDTYVKLASNPDVRVRTDKDMASLFSEGAGEAPEESKQEYSYNISLVSNPTEYTLYITATSDNPAVASNAANLYASNVKEFLQTTMQSNEATIIVAATPAREPQGNRMSLIALAAGVIGLVAGAGIVLIMDSMDETIKNAEDLTKYVDVMVLAEVPKIEKEKKNGIRIRQKKYADGHISTSTKG